jgi:hypothetical protein
MDIVPKTPKKISPNDSDSDSEKKFSAIPIPTPTPKNFIFTTPTPMQIPSSNRSKNSANSICFYYILRENNSYSILIRIFNGF